MAGCEGSVLRMKPLRPRCRRRDRPAAPLRALFLALAMFLAGLPPALAAAKPLRADVSLSTGGGFGRMIVSFSGINVMPPHRVSTDNGILVITFDEAIAVSIDQVPSALRDYVTIARADPEGRGLRFALARFVHVNTMDAGPELFVDFLPRGWTGPPPRLPDEVIAELARRADEAAKEAAKAELFKLTGGRPARLTVSASRAPTFTRLTFAWNLPFDADFQRTDGGVRLAFDRSANADLSAIKADLPPFVDDISAEPTADGLVFAIAVEPVADVRAFKDGDAYVVDVLGPPDPATLNPVDRSLLAAVGGVVPPGVTGLVHAGGNPPPPAPTATGHAAAPPQAPGEALRPPAVVAPLARTGDDRGGGATPARDGNEPAVRPEIAELPNNAAVRTLSDGLVRVEAVRVGQSARLVFPYGQTVGAAMFMRESTVWMVFDSAAPIDSASLQDALVGFARRIERMPLKGGQAIRVELTQPYLMTMSPDGSDWIVTIGEMVSDPTRSLTILRRVGSGGARALDIPFGPVAGIHRFSDPLSGETMFVVTGKGQPRGLAKPQHFAELDALASIHGVALVSKVDDLSVGADGEQIMISRPGGLSVSTVAEQKKASLVDLPRVLGSSLSRKTGFVDFKDMAVGAPPEYWQRRHKLMAELTAAADGAQRIAKWYRIATFELANGFGAETVGVLDLIGRLSPEETAAEKMAVLRAGGEALAHRPEATLHLLDGPKYRDSPDAAVWRAMALSDLGRHGEAMEDFSRGDVVIETFPPVIARRYVLAEVASAIETGNFDLARERLAKMDPRELSRADRARLELLNALSRDAAGRASDAVALLSGIVRGHDGEAAAEATYRLVQIQRREGLITLDQAIDRLEQLAVSWRGDELELKTLRLLGQYSVARGNYRRAFEVMRVAEQIKPDAKTSRLMNEEMQAAFARLFLDGGADAMSPVEALALYYDFRELTPNGRRGDAMVRKLADRLVDVDLLGQAEALLSYQVENRLRGAARAQTAADLALVYLLDRRPDKALFTLAKTRQAQLPVAIERQRRVVEAKAMARSGNVDGALELISPFGGADIERLAADILWSANRYAEAGGAFEKLLGGRWSDQLPLTQDEQLEVLKAGIAYTLAGDRLSVDRLRSKYVTKMASSPNGSAFEAVSGPIVADGADFNAVVKSVAAADTMTSFLADYRKRYLDSGGGKPDVVTGGMAAEQAAPAAGARTG